MAYRPPAFSLGDEVVVTRPDPADKLRRIQTPGYVAGFEAIRDEKGAFQQWKYRIASLNENKDELCEEIDVSGRTILLKNYTKRM